MPRIIITGGGTGGHLYPMLAIADSLCAAGVSAHEIRLIGSSRGEDRRILAESNYRVSLWPGRGIRRSISPRALLANARALVGITGSFILGVVTAVFWRPDVVVSVGGYASFPMSLGAVLTRRTLILVELDAATGLAQRLVKRFATKRCVAFATDDPRAVVTGVPLRATLQHVSPETRVTAKSAMVPKIESSKTVVLVMTGSLGAKSVNDAISELAVLWASRTDVALIQVTGRRDFARVKSREVHEALDYRIIEFADMTKLWPIADIAICRAGATTVAELGVVGVPAVLIPLPNSPSDHQAHNARALEEAGAAFVIEDSELSATTLAATLEKLFSTETRGSMAKRMQRMGHPQASADIAEVIVKACNR